MRLAVGLRTRYSNNGSNPSLTSPGVSAPGIAWRMREMLLRSAPTFIVLGLLL